MDSEVEIYNYTDDEIVDVTAMNLIEEFNMTEDEAYEFASSILDDLFKTSLGRRSDSKSNIKD